MWIFLFFHLATLTLGINALCNLVTLVFHTNFLTVLISMHGTFNYFQFPLHNAVKIIQSALSYHNIFQNFTSFVLKTSKLIKPLKNHFKPKPNQVDHPSAKSLDSVQHQLGPSSMKRRPSSWRPLRRASRNITWSLSL